jgi:hypothetical protein
MTGIDEGIPSNYRSSYMKNLFFHIFLLTVIQINLYSQNINDSYQFRKDQFDPRKEGIKEKHINVSGDRILLLSALINTLQDVTPVPDTIHLGFYTENRIASSVSITDDTTYFVDPENTEWGPGLATFIWPTAIMQRNNISPKNLYVRTVLMETSKHFIFPACLYYRKPPTRVKKYTFVIVPQRTMNLKYWIIDPDSDRVIRVGPGQTIRGYKKYNISWDCLDEESNPVHEGEYIFKIQGKYYDTMGRILTVSTSYKFYHKIQFGN